MLCCCEELVSYIPWIFDFVSSIIDTSKQRKRRKKRREEDEDDFRKKKIGKISIAEIDSAD